MHRRRQCQSLFLGRSSLAAISTLAMAIGFALAVSPVLAQNTASPSARQAAASPAFASRLHPPAGGGHLLRPPHARRTQGLPQDGVIYDNGPYNGTTDAWDINFGFSVSDSFTVPPSSTLTGLHFVYWDASISDLLTLVDMAIGSTSFGGSVQTLRGVTNTFLGINQYGYALYQADYTLSGPSWSGPGYITLSNACSTSGCSISNPIYWDENGGPSTAYENTLGSIPSETFNITGTSYGGPPEDCFTPGDGGVQVIHNFTATEGHPDGVVNDKAGNLYGTSDGGISLFGVVYKLAPNGQDWILSPLYKFSGGDDGNYPSPVLLGPEGPEGGLYGTTYGGGITTCEGIGCGLVYRLTPAPKACLATSCNWTQSVLYRFTGINNDGWYPNGNLVFDRAGILYGTTDAGGAQREGIVYALAPSPGGWPEQVVYSFPIGFPQADSYPSGLLVGTDGNLYGSTTFGGDLSCDPPYGCGKVFQLVPSGGGWIENDIYTFQAQDDGVQPRHLVQDSSGNLYGTTYSTAFMLSPSIGGWTFRLIGQFGSEQYSEDINNLAIDTAGNLYVTTSHWAGCGWSNCSSPADDDRAFGAVYMRPPGANDFIQIVRVGGVFDNTGPLAIDGTGNLYGTTRTCGSNQYGTLWTLPHSARLPK